MHLENIESAIFMQLNVKNLYTLFMYVCDKRVHSAANVGFLKLCFGILKY